MRHVAMAEAHVWTRGSELEEPRRRAQRDAVEALRRTRVVGCLRMRAHTARARVLALDATRAALDAGLEAYEATLDSPHAADVLQRIAESHPHVLLGAGTANDVRRVSAIVWKKLHFATSPTRAKEASTWLANEEKHVLFVPGVATPTEARTAWCEDDATVLKVYPSRRETMQALRDVMPEAVLMASGGMQVDDVTEMVAAGAHVVVLGSALFDLDDVASGNTKRIQERVRRAVRLAEEAGRMVDERNARRAELWEGLETRDSCAAG